MSFDLFTLFPCHGKKKLFDENEILSQIHVMKDQMFKINFKFYTTNNLSAISERFINIICRFQNIRPYKPHPFIDVYTYVFCSKISTACFFHFIGYSIPLGML